MTYVLHYAPDNASLIIRLALEQIGVPYRTVLVDRSQNAQNSAPYKALNPHGLIPTLETPQGAIFETGAILLWLADTHGGLGPAADAPERADFLKWVFFTSNTLHPALRMLFYPEKYVGSDAQHQRALRAGVRRGLVTHYQKLDDLAAQRPNWFAAPTPSALDFYVAACLRWPALYPNGEDKSWFDIAHYPHLLAMCAHLETLPLTHTLHTAEGLGLAPFTAPQPANPPEGSAL